MLKKISGNIKEHPIFFIGYLVFLIVLIMILVKYSKTESLIIVNHSWSSFQDVFFKYCTYLGDGWFAVSILAFLFFYRLKYGIIATICFSTTALITQFLKKVIYSDVARPSIELYNDFQNNVLHKVEGVELLKGNSFPSGHTTSIFSICCLLTLLFSKSKLGPIFIIIASFTSYSRIYLSQHFFEDVFVGSIIGCVGTLVIYTFLLNIKWGSWAEYSFFKKK